MECESKLSVLDSDVDNAVVLFAIYIVHVPTISHMHYRLSQEFVFGQSL